MQEATAKTTIALTVLTLLPLAGVWGDEDLTRRLETAGQRAIGGTFTLQYKFQPGEEFRTRVTHQTTVKTKIEGSSETAKSRSVSTKLWKIKEVDDDGNILLVHMIESVDMWHQLSGRDEVRYNSSEDSEPPLEYKMVAESLGKPLATVTINKFGRVIQRVNANQQFNPAIGDLTAPLPEQPIKVGTRWYLPDEIPVPTDGGQVLRIKARKAYRLINVEEGVATISVKTEILTPLSDPAVEAKLVERLKEGEIKFDVQAGRLISSQMDLDKSVLSFRGAGSSIHYIARLSEEALSSPKTAPPQTAAKPKPDGEQGPRKSLDLRR